ncbi:DUF6985 domain-containing protein [Bremerella cremea]|uniref:DUF6985 domain-containing protein n=1 Tax=Bremerella cremea TaxID=1031537 RepID=UPI0031F0390E
MDKYQHPSLGTLFLEDDQWLTEEGEVTFVDEVIRIVFARGTEEGPSDASLEGFEWIDANWSKVLTLIEDQAFEFYQSYDNSVEEFPEFAKPADIWGSEYLLGLRIFSPEEFEVTLQFDWQEEDDEHEITFYIEEGECNSYSRDG